MDRRVAAGAIGDIAEVAGTVVGHRVMLEVSPDAFDRIHIRRVGGQVVDHDLTVLGLDMSLARASSGGPAGDPR